MAVDYDILRRSSNTADQIAQGMASYRQNQLLQMQQQQQAQAQQQQQEDMLYRQQLGQFLGNNTVNTLLPVADQEQQQQVAHFQMLQQEQQNQLMRMNPMATMQAMKEQGALQAQADAVREKQQKDQQALALRITRGAQLAMESQAPGRYIKTQYPDLVAAAAKDGMDVNNMTDDQWRGVAKQMYDEFLPQVDARFGLDPGAEMQMKKVTQSINLREIAAREKELQLRENKANTPDQSELFDPDTLNLAVTDVMADPKAMLNYAKYKGDSAKRTQINKEIAGRLKDAGMSPGDLIKIRASAVGERKSISDMTKQLNAVNNFEDLAKFNGQRVLELIDKLDDTGVPWVEGLTRHIKRGVGGVDAAELNSVLTPFQTEVARIITNPNMTGVLSDSAREEVQKMASGDMSAKQAKRVINRMFTEMDVRRAAIENRINVAGSAMVDRLPGAGGKMPEQSQGNVVNWNELK